MPDLERPEVRRVTGLAGDRVRRRTRSTRTIEPHPERGWRCGEKRAERCGLGEPVALHHAGERHRPPGEHRAGRALDAQGDVDLAAAAGPAATRMARAAIESRVTSGEACATCPPSSRGIDVKSRAAGLLARTRLPVSRAVRLTFPALSSQWPPCGDAGRTPLQRRDRAGFAPASLDRSRGASVPGRRVTPRRRDVLGDGSQPQSCHDATTHHRCTFRRAGTWSQPSYGRSPAG